MKSPSAQPNCVDQTRECIHRWRSRWSAPILVPSSWARVIAGKLPRQSVLQEIHDGRNNQKSIAPKRMRQQPIPVVRVRLAIGCILPYCGCAPVWTNRNPLRVARFFPGQAEHHSQDEQQPIHETTRYVSGIVNEYQFRNPDIATRSFLADRPETHRALALHVLTVPANK